MFEVKPSMESTSEIYHRGVQRLQKLELGTNTHSASRVPKRRPITPSKQDETTQYGGGAEKEANFPCIRP